MIDPKRVPATILFLFGAMSSLRDRGLLGGAAADIITPRGAAGFDQLEASGFRPTEEEIVGALNHMQQEGMLDFDQRSLEGLVVLLANWDRVKEAHP